MDSAAANEPASLTIPTPASATAPPAYATAAPSTTEPPRQAAPHRVWLETMPSAPPPPLTLVGRSTTALGPFELWAEPRMHEVGAQMLAQAPHHIARILADLPPPPRPRPIQVRLVHATHSFKRLAPEGRGAPDYAIGVAYPDVGIVLVAQQRGGTIEDPMDTLEHELAHIVLGAAVGAQVPRWLHEGFAYLHSHEHSFARIDTLAHMGLTKSFIPIHQLDLYFPLSEMPAHRAYAQSYDFVLFLAKRGRWEDAADDGDRVPFRRFLEALATGATLHAAAVAAYGRPVDTLFVEWQEDLASRHLIPADLVTSALGGIMLVLLALAWRRQRRLRRIRLDGWAAEEARAHAFAHAHSHLEGLYAEAAIAPAEAAIAPAEAQPGSDNAPMVEREALAEAPIIDAIAPEDKPPLGLARRHTS